MIAANSWRSSSMIDGAAACALALFTGGVYAAVIAPRMSAAADHQERLTVLEEQSAAARRFEEDLQNSQRALLEARGSAEKGEVRLARADEINARLATLMHIAEGLRLGSVKIEQVQPGAATREGQFAVVPIRLAGEATYTSCAEFLAALHAQLKDTAVVAMTLNAESGAGQPVRGRFTVDLAWYALPPSTGVADAARQGRN